MDVYHFRNFELLDPDAGELRGGHELVVEGDRIKEVSGKPIKLENADVIDCGGRTVMPGLIDSHVHVVLSEVVLRNLESVPLTLMTARAAGLMRAMLDRGFTSVRDTGGADWGLKEATDKGFLPGPRLFIAGRAIGPTGGHSDGRCDAEQHDRARCDDPRRDQNLRAADTQHLPAHRHQARQREFQSQSEDQEHDAEVGEKLRGLVVRRERKRMRTQEHSHGQISQNGGQGQFAHGGDDAHRRREQYQDL